MAEHSKLPWSIDDAKNYLFKDAEGSIVGELWSPEEEEQDIANAAFIVKAVNMHDELVSAIGKIDSIMRRNLTATNKLDKIAGILTDIDPVLAKALEA